MNHFETNFFSYTNTSLKCVEDVGHVRDAKFVFVNGSHRPLITGPSIGWDVLYI